MSQSYKMYGTAGDATAARVCRGCNKELLRDHSAVHCLALFLFWLDPDFLLSAFHACCFHKGHFPKVDSVP